MATVSLSGTLDEKLAAAARAGFDGVEIFENDLIASPWTPAQVRRRAGDLGLSIDLYQPFRDFEGVGEEELARNLRRARAKFEVMEELGADTMLVCSSVSPDALDDDVLAATQLSALGDLAGQWGMRVAYEALAWGRNVSDYRHAWQLVAAADHPQVGICLDSFHILSRGHDASGIRDIPGEKIFFLQLADAPNLVMDVLQWSRHYRCFPGQGGFDLPDFLGHVLAAGYRGPLSLEVFNDVFRQADAERTAIDALRSLLALEEAVREHLPGSGRTGSAPAGTASAGTAPARERLELCAPPAAVAPMGYAFAEIAVDGLSGPDTERVLRTMGFHRVAEHRTKPVALWEAGGVRLLLNRADARLTGTLDGDAVITALAIESSDPVQSVRRAETLLAPVLPRQRGRDEADISAVAAPDGTSLFFCRTGGERAASWLGDFDGDAGADTADTSAKDTRLRGIDHVALSHPVDSFDEAALFYRCVLGLQPRESLELAAPDGLVRSRALASVDGSVRIALNVSVVASDRTARHPSEAQHLAFGCHDIFATARAMRAAGADLLPIPGNYYDDLAARTELDSDLLHQMRELGILYDRGPRGEFFHLYTPLIGRRLFFEVTQRVDDYDGYGAFNAPVRMAAQRLKEPV